MEPRKKKGKKMKSNKAQGVEQSNRSSNIFPCESILNQLLFIYLFLLALWNCKVVLNNQYPYLPSF